MPKMKVEKIYPSLLVADLAMAERWYTGRVPSRRRDACRSAGLIRYGEKDAHSRR